MLPDDLAEFEAALVARGDVIFCPVRQPSRELCQAPTLAPLPEDFGMRYLVRQGDYEKLRIDHVPQQGCYVIRAAHSPVVEFSRSKLVAETGRLSQGRLWFATAYSEGEVRREPAEDFLKWADSLVKMIRKSKHYSPLKEPQHKGLYISRRAAAWREQGGVLG
jgi:hypothetical protein